MLQSMNSRLGDHINIFNKFIYFFLRNVLFTKILNDSDQPPISELAIEIPGGNRILVKNIIAQQITRKRGIFKKTLECKQFFHFFIFQMFF